MCIRDSTWTTEASLPSGRQYLGAAAVGNTLYAIGGSQFDQEHDFMTTVEAFTPGEGWKSRAPLPGPRSNFFVAARDGLIFVAGGRSRSGKNNTLFVYNTASNAWSALAPMPAGRCGSKVAGFINGRFY